VAEFWAARAKPLQVSSQKHRMIRAGRFRQERGPAASALAARLLNCGSPFLATHFPAAVLGLGVQAEHVKDEFPRRLPRLLLNVFPSPKARPQWAQRTSMDSERTAG